MGAPTRPRRSNAFGQGPGCQGGMLKPAWCWAPSSPVAVDLCRVLIVKYLHDMKEMQTAALDKVLLLSSLVAADMSRFERDSRLTAARARLLWTLGLNGPTPQHALAQELGVTPRNITGLVDGLVDSGHVTREPHPTDRRALVITPTPVGERTITELQTGHAELATRLFGDVPAEQLGVFLATLDETIAKFTDLMEGLS